MGAEILARGTGGLLRIICGYECLGGLLLGAILFLQISSVIAFSRIVINNHPKGSFQHLWC